MGAWHGGMIVYDHHALAVSLPKAGSRCKAPRVAPLTDPTHAEGQRATYPRQRPLRIADEPGCGDDGAVHPWHVVQDRVGGGAVG